MDDFSGHKILVTGGTGHLGSALVRELAGGRRIPPRDIRVLFLEGTPTDGLADIAGLDLCPGDIRRPEDVERAARGVGFVFHLAASTSFDPRGKRTQWLVNVEGTRNVLDAAERSTTIRKVCHTSTVNVLGVPDPPGSLGDFDSADPFRSRPRLHSFAAAGEALRFADDVRAGRIARWEKRLGIGYFDSKLAAQEMVTERSRTAGLNVVSVLPGTFFGPGGPLVGNGAYLLALYRRKMPGVLGGGMSLGHVGDIVDGHLLAMERGAPGSRHIITGRREDNLHFREIMSILVETLRRRFPDRRIPLPSTVWPTPLASAAAALSEGFSSLFHGPCLLSRGLVKAGSRPLFYACEGARRDLGYVPRRSFREAAEEMCRDYDERGFFSA